MPWKRRPSRLVPHIGALGQEIAYFAAEAVASLRRNGLMTIAAVTTVMVALLTVGAAVLIGLGLTHLAAAVEGQVEVIAFLRDGLTPADAAQLVRRVAALPGVAAVRFVGRDEALTRLQKQLGGTPVFADLANANPLPDSLKIQLADPRKVAAAAAAIGRQPGVEEVSYGAQVVDRLVLLTRGVRVVAALLTLFLAAVALIVVVNTIRLTVMARQQEIEIMQLVGATRWFIRWPFLIEGILQGTAAAVAATLVLVPLYAVVAARLQVSIPFLPIVPMTQALTPLVGSVLSAGMVVGASGSLVAVRRFLSP